MSLPPKPLSMLPAALPTRRSLPEPPYRPSTVLVTLSRPPDGPSLLLPSSRLLFPIVTSTADGWSE